MGGLSSFRLLPTYPLLQSPGVPLLPYTDTVSRVASGSHPRRDVNGPCSSQNRSIVMRRTVEPDLGYVGVAGEECWSCLGSGYPFQNNHLPSIALMARLYL